MVIHPFSPAAAAGLLAVLAFAWGEFAYLTERILTPPMTREESLKSNGLMGMFALLFALLGFSFCATSPYFSVAAFVVFGAVVGQLVGRALDIRLNAVVLTKFAVTGIFAGVLSLLLASTGRVFDMVLAAGAAIALGQLVGILLRNLFVRKAR